MHRACTTMSDQSMLHDMCMSTVTISAENQSVDVSRSPGRKETMAVMPSVYGDERTLQFATSFFQQFWIILGRLIVQRRRNKVSLDGYI